MLTIALRPTTYCGFLFMPIQDIEIRKVVMLPDGRMDSRNTATYMGLADKTLAMMRCEGTGPKFIKRGRIFYYKEDIDEWLNSEGRHTSTAQVRQAISK